MQNFLETTCWKESEKINVQLIQKIYENNYAKWKQV